MSDFYGQTEAENLADHIVKLGSSLESLDLFRSNKTLLNGWKFVLPSNKGAVPGFCVNRSFKNKAVVRSLFSTEKVIVIDRETIEEMEKGGSTFAIDFSVSLDTMILSYVEGYIKNPSKEESVRIFDIMKFIASPEVSIDAIPYLQENMQALIHGSKAQKYKIYSSMLSYEIIRSIDKKHLASTGDITSYLSRRQRRKNTLDLLKSNEKRYGNLNDKEDFRCSQKIMHCILIKIVIIHLKYGYQTVAERMLRLMEFFDEEMGLMAAREMLLASEYFQRGTKLKFFGKIQKGREDIFTSLENMAWDMWHIRQCEEGISKKPQEPCRYFFPGLLTQDNRLIEVIDICSLDAAIIKPNGVLMSVHSKNVFDTVFKDQPAYILARARSFYSSNSRRKREIRQGEKKRNSLEYYNSVANKLKEDLSAICKIQEKQTKTSQKETCSFFDV